MRPFRDQSLRRCRAPRGREGEGGAPEPLGKRAARLRLESKARDLHLDRVCDRRRARRKALQKRLDELLGELADEARARRRRGDGLNQAGEWIGGRSVRKERRRRHRLERLASGEAKPPGQRARREEIGQRLLDRLSAAQPQDRSGGFTSGGRLVLAGSVHGRGVISGKIGGGKRADPGVELGWSPRQAVSGGVAGLPTDRRDHDDRGETATE